MPTRIQNGYTIRVSRAGSEELLRLLGSRGASVGKIDQKGEGVEISLSRVSDNALARIKLLHPDAAISKSEGKEKHLSYSLPEVITGLLACSNKNCITAYPKEPVNRRFKVVSVDPPKLMCYYCGRYIPRDSLTAQLAT